MCFFFFSSCRKVEYGVHWTVVIICFKSEFNSITAHTHTLPRIHQSINSANVLAYIYCVLIAFTLLIFRCCSLYDSDIHIRGLCVMISHKYIYNHVARAYIYTNSTRGHHSCVCSRQPLYSD